jgi:hypothetical protein
LRVRALFGSGLPFELSELLEEIYLALWGKHYRLALMGIRALLEAAMIRKVGDLGSFSKNLDAFVQDGFISRVQREHLIVVLEAGHASTHRMYKPNESELNTLLEIAESVLEAVYIHGTAAKKLAGRVPARRFTGKVVPFEGRLRRPNNAENDDGAE